MAEVINPIIISSISNKGGVGKTIFSIEMANLLGKMGKKVLLIDTDMNTGDISIKLALKNNFTLLDFFEKKEKNLNRIVKRFNNSDLIPGEGGNFKFANINYAQKVKFIKAFKEISRHYDYTILDLCAGIERVTLDFALTADYMAIITTPEDIQTAYGCAKAAAERMSELENRLSDRGMSNQKTKHLSPFFVFNKSEKERAYNIFTGVRKAAALTQSQNEIEIKPLLLKTST